MGRGGTGGSTAAWNALADVCLYRLLRARKPVLADKAYCPAFNASTRSGLIVMARSIVSFTNF